MTIVDFVGWVLVRIKRAPILRGGKKKNRVNDKRFIDFKRLIDFFDLRINRLLIIIFFASPRAIRRRFIVFVVTPNRPRFESAETLGPRRIQPFDTRK